MLFKVAHAEAIARGDITCTIRKWKRTQVVAGRLYATPRGYIEVDSVDVGALRDVSKGDLTAAGFQTVDDLSEYGVAPDDEVHVVRFRAVEAPAVDDLGADDQLSDDDVEMIVRRLRKMDDARPEPWSRRVLESFSAEPGTGSAVLAGRLGIEQTRLKADIRKLKRLGLTRSLERGYALSPRGRAFLDQMAD